MSITRNKIHGSITGILFVVLCFFFSFPAFAITSTFEAIYSFSSGKNIKRFKVCGERCSGTNYAAYLVKKNFPSLVEVGPHTYGHKHFMIWQGVSVKPASLSRLEYGNDATSFKHSDDCLFLIVIRNPYDWVRSFYRTPYHVCNELASGSFVNFISSEWRISEIKKQPFHGFYDEIDNKNPFSGKPFDNVFDLRKHKILNYLKICKKVANAVFVRYEDIRDDPRAFIKFIATTFNTKHGTKLKKITKYKGVAHEYFQRKYFTFSTEELKILNNSVDWNLENIMGYRRHENVKKFK